MEPDTPHVHVGGGGVWAASIPRLGVQDRGATVAVRVAVAVLLLAVVTVVIRQGRQVAVRPVVGSWNDDKKKTNRKIIRQ